MTKKTSLVIFTLLNNNLAFIELARYENIHYFFTKIN